SFHQLAAGSAGELPRPLGVPGRNTRVQDRRGCGRREGGLKPLDFFLTPYAESFPFKYDSNERRELVPYLVKSPATPLISSYLEGITRERVRTIDFIVEFTRRVAG